MKSTAKRIYPYLGISKEISYNNINPLIVLFTGDRKGVAISNICHPHKLGDYSDQWCENNFIPYNGIITIEF